MRRRLYVLVDKNLDPVYACVQGSHAVAQFLIEHSAKEWNNEYLIFLYADVEKWLRKLERVNSDFSVFNEPDLGGRMTTIATVSDGRMFKDLKLIKA